MPKKIPHKKFFILFFFLCFAGFLNAQPIVITKNGAGICPGGRITLSTNDPSLVSYKWEIYRASGWSAIPYGDAPTLTNGEVGKYHLLARDNLGNSRISNELDIVGLLAPPVPIVTPSRNVSQICQGDSIILSTIPQPGYFYYWVFDNVQLSIPQTVNLTAKKAGTYELLVVDQSLASNACTSKSASFKLDYTSTIIVKIDSVPPICKLTNPPIILTVTPTGGKFKGKGITDNNNGVFSPSVAGVGKHEIIYEVAQNGSCPSLVEKRILVVSNPQSIITTNTGKTQFCLGDVAILSAPAGMKKYEWTAGGFSAGNVDKLTVTTSGDYQLKITDNETCTSLSPSVKVDFYTTTIIKTDPIPSVCGLENAPIPLKGSPTGGAFTINGAFATVFDYKKIGFGKHKVVYTLDGSLPCLKGSSQQEVAIQDFPKPDLGSDILLGKGGSVILKGAVEGGVSYSWTPATDLDNPTTANPLAKPDKTTEYVVKVLSSNGCPGEGKVNIVVYEPVYIPTAFTPNNDGTNDRWELSGIEVYPNPEVQIFNRWGNVIFYSKGNYVPFDGTDNTKPLPEGIYVYKINPFPDRPDFQYKGTFVLFR